MKLIIVFFALFLLTFGSDQVSDTTAPLGTEVPTGGYGYKVPVAGCYSHSLSHVITVANENVCRRKCSERYSCASYEYKHVSVKNCDLQPQTKKNPKGKTWSYPCNNWYYIEKRPGLRYRPKYGRKGCYPGYALMSFYTPHKAYCQFRCDFTVPCRSFEYTPTYKYCQLQVFDDYNKGSRYWTSSCGSWRYYGHRRRGCYAGHYYAAKTVPNWNECRLECEASAPCKSFEYLEGAPTSTGNCQLQNYDDASPPVGFSHSCGNWYYYQWRTQDAFWGTDEKLVSTDGLELVGLENPNDPASAKEEVGDDEVNAKAVSSGIVSEMKDAAAASSSSTLAIGAFAGFGLVGIAGYLYSRKQNPTYDRLLTEEDM